MGSEMIKYLFILLYIFVLFLISGLFYFICDKTRTWVYNRILSRDTIDQKLAKLISGVDKLHSAREIFKKEFPLQKFENEALTACPAEKTIFANYLFLSCLNFCKRLIKSKRQSRYLALKSIPLEYAGQYPKNPKFYDALDLNPLWKKLLA